MLLHSQGYIRYCWEKTTFKTIEGGRVVTEDDGHVMGEKGNYEKEHEHVNSNDKCNTDDQPKHKCEQKDNSDPQARIEAQEMYTCKIQMSRAYVNDMVPIVDIDTFKTLVCIIYKKVWVSRQ